MHSAAQLASEGFRVFPLRQSADHNEAKRPVGEGWQAFATSDVEAAERRWSGQYSGCGIGVRTGDGLLIIDVDQKHGRDGGMSLFELEMELGALPRTREAATPTGGRHKYFRVPAGTRIGNAVDRMPGIDWRGEGGYVVGPGSVLPGGAYSWVDPLVPIAPLPEAWTAFMRTRSVRAGLNGSGSGLVLSDLDTPAGIERAIRYLRKEAPEAIEGAGGDAATFAVCARVVRDFAISSGRALSLISEHWNWAGKAAPPWDAADLAAKIDSAIRSGHGPIGGGLGVVEFGDATVEPGWSLKRRSNNGAEAASDANALLDIRSATELLARPLKPREWHVEGLIPAKTVTLLYGDGATGKSLLALQLCAATVARAPWLGMNVRGGGAVYFGCEDDDEEIQRRLDDIARGSGLAPEQLEGMKIILMAGKTETLLAVPGTAGRATLTPTRLWRTLAAYIDTFQPALIVLDNLADIFGGDENARNQVKQFANLCTGLAIRTRCAIVILAHPSLTGIATGSGSSGSTGWSNSVRSRLYLTKVVGDDGGEADPDMRSLTSKKTNYDRVGRSVEMRWQAGMFVPVEKTDPFGDDDEAERVRVLFLELLDQYDAQGRRVSAFGGPTYAPAVFEKEGVARGTTRRQMVSAMNYLFANEHIRMEETGPASKRRSRIVKTQSLYAP